MGGIEETPQGRGLIEHGLLGRLRRLPPQRCGAYSRCFVRNKRGGQAGRQRLGISPRRRVPRSRRALKIGGAQIRVQSLSSRGLILTISVEIVILAST